MPLPLLRERLRAEAGGATGVPEPALPWHAGWLGHLCLFLAAGGGPEELGDAHPAAPTALRALLGPPRWWNDAGGHGSVLSMVTWGLLPPAYPDAAGLWEVVVRGCVPDAPTVEQVRRLLGRGRLPQPGRPGLGLLTWAAAPERLDVPPEAWEPLHVQVLLRVLQAPQVDRFVWHTALRAGFPAACVDVLCGWKGAARRPWFVPLHLHTARRELTAGAARCRTTAVLSRLLDPRPLDDEVVRSVVRLAVHNPEPAVPRTALPCLERRPAPSPDRGRGTDAPACAQPTDRCRPTPSAPSSRALWCGAGGRIRGCGS